MRYLLLSLFVTGCLACESGQSTRTGRKTGLGLDTVADVYNVSGEDESMNAAIAKAIETQSEFDRAVKSGNAAYSDFAVKKKYETGDDGGEHMWIAGLRLVDGGYRGYVNNDAAQTTAVKYGDTVLVKRDEITDWMYLDNGVLRGGYTIREIVRNLNEAERRTMQADLGFKIDDQALSR